MGLRAIAPMLAAAAALAGACATRSTTAPPPAASRADVKPGKFVWHDLVTDDLDACRRFYGALLGWDFEDSQRLGRPYVVARSGGRPVAGMVAIRPAGPEKSSQWVGYVSVPDVDRAVEAVTKAGGRALVAPVEVGTVARAAVVADPQGAVLGLARIAAGDPPDEASPTENRFFWMEYLAGDPGAAVAFYTGLLGYQSAVTDAIGDVEYHVLRSGRPRAGLLRAPREGVRPAWLPYVLAKDPEALASRAASLGGRVLLAPRADLRKGTLAIVADPSGAALALQRWPI
jgi:predicted enzyme related to lactoylglutathione lyase